MCLTRHGCYAKPHWPRQKCNSDSFKFYYPDWLGALCEGGGRVVNYLKGSRWTRENGRQFAPGLHACSHCWKHRKEGESKKTDIEQFNFWRDSLCTGGRFQYIIFYYNHALSLSRITFGNPGAVSQWGSGAAVGQCGTRRWALVRWGEETGDAELWNSGTVKQWGSRCRQKCCASGDDKIIVCTPLVWVIFNSGWWTMHHLCEWCSTLGDHCLITTCSRKARFTVKELTHRETKLF